MSSWYQVGGTAWRSVGEALHRCLPLATLAWLAGVAVLALRMLGGLVATRRLCRRGVRGTTAFLAEQADRIASELGIRRGVTVLESSLVGVPVVVGWLRPVLLLPAATIVNLTTKELEAMLMHELAHVRRHDYLVNLVQTVIETLLFFHPAVWWLSRRIRIERENCCDDAAVALLGDRKTYARALYRTAQLGAANTQLVTAATGGDLTNRFRRLLGLAPLEKRAGGSWAGALACLATAAALVGVQYSPLLAQNPAGSEPAPQPPTEVAAAPRETAPPSPGPGEAVEEEGPTALEIWAAARALNREALVEMIGRRKERLNRVHDNGFAALHWAANNRRPDSIKLLLDLGAGVNVKQGKFGGAPLQYAAKNGDVASMEVLLKRMARVDAADNLGRTPLMWAAQKGHEKAVKVLLEAGADVNAAMKGGWTPLHYAVKAGDAKSAQRLIDAGADLTLTNKLGKTPLEVGPELDLRLTPKPE
jgi:beta-lactamase regulating signal transducer with metallopeptidase domain